jgi:iron complex outermembrane receptor protein
MVVNNLMAAFIVVIMFGFNLQAQTLSGQVKDAESLENIPFAKVYILELELGTVADSSGKFSFSVPLPETVRLRISSIGYESAIVRANSGARDLTVYVYAKHMEIEEVIVSGNQSTLQKFNVIHVETRKLSDLSSIPGTNLMQSLEQIPGVYNASTGTGISKPVIRGMQGMRVVTMLNGLRLENQQWGGDHGMAVTELGVGSVEVIKGPSSLLYGADALGGVIYFVDEPYAAINSSEYQFKTQFESVSVGNRSSFLYKTSGNKVRLNVGGLFSNHADYALPNGRFANNSRFGENVFRASLGTNKKNWSMHLRYSFARMRVGIPGHTHDSIVDPTEFQVDYQNRFRVLPVQYTTNHFLSFENKWFVKRNEFKLLLGQTWSKLTEFEDKITIPGVGMDLFNTLISFRYTRYLKENLSLVTGYQGMGQINRNNPFALEFLLPNAITLDNGGFTLLNYERRKWNFQGGVRFDQRVIQSLEMFKGQEEILKSYAGLNYALGTVYSDKYNTYRMNLSSGFRAPHLSELLANGYHHGALRYELGNIGLRAEQAHQIDLTYERKGEHLGMVVNPFIGLVNNYIYLQPLDTVIDGLPAFAYRQFDQIVMNGVDLSVHFHPHFAHWLHWEGSFSYIDLQDRNGNYTSLIPQSRISNLIKLNFPESKRKFHLEKFTVQHSYLFEQSRVALEETTSRAYQLINASLDAKLKGRLPMEFKVGARNILNENYIDHLSRLKNISLPHQGRNFFVSVAFQIVNFKTK